MAMHELDSEARGFGSSRISRRRFLGGMAVAAVAGPALAACAPGTSSSPGGSSGSAASAAAFDWKKHAGTTLNAVMTNNPPNTTIKGELAKFEALTGIKVTYQDLELASMRDKQNVVFSAGSDEIDVWHTFLINEGVGYARNGWYEDLMPYVQNPSLTAPDYNFDDFGSSLALASVEGKKGIATIGKGILAGIPMWVDVWGLYYNKDILDKAGVKPPTTMDELEQAAKACHDPANGVYGWVTRGTSPLNTGSAINAFFSLGAQWVDASGKASLATKEAEAVLDYWGRMMHLYGPPNAYTLDIAPANALFAAGKVAFYHDSPSFAGTLRDPAKSTVSNSVQFVEWPAGSAGSRPEVDCWAACISKYSAKKEAAWLFVQWMTSPDMQLLLAPSSAPSRASVASGTQYADIVKKIAPNYPAIVTSGLKTGDPNCFPPVAGVPQARQVWGDALVQAMQGGDSKAIAAEANGKLQAIIDQEA
jgi:multiple sugar transport system substrate-binding protein